MFQKAENFSFSPLDVTTGGHQRQLTCFHQIVIILIPKVDNFDSILSLNYLLPKSDKNSTIGMHFPWPFHIYFSGLKMSQYLNDSEKEEEFQVREQTALRDQWF